MKTGKLCLFLLIVAAVACGSDDPAPIDGDDPMDGPAATGDGDSGDGDSGDGDGNVGDGDGNIGDGDGDGAIVVGEDGYEPDALNQVVDGKYPDPRGYCDIDSGFPGDDKCLLPPHPDKGIQIHIGPEDYTNEAEVEPFLLAAGDENSECWTFHLPNDEPFFYQNAVLSGRDGTHHIINTMFSNELPDGGFTVCQDGGAGVNASIVDNLPGASKAFMPRMLVAPENKGVGREIPGGKLAAQADMHYFNYTDDPILREFWLNIYYAEEEITEPAQQIRGFGGLSWNRTPVPPGTDMVYSYECPIVGDGRITSILGHYHAQGKKFTASIRRKATGDVEKVFEMYDYLDPAIFSFNSVEENPKFSDSQAGATSGMLEVKDGDVLMWDCHIVNDLEVGLTYSNEVVGGEMCNIWGTSVGIQKINCLLF